MNHDRVDVTEAARKAVIAELDMICCRLYSAKLLLDAVRGEEIDRSAGIEGVLALVERSGAMVDACQEKLGGMPTGNFTARIVEVAQEGGAA